MTKKKKHTKREVVQALAEYIIENGPVTYTEIARRAMTRSWYSIAAFDAVIETIHRHPQISASVRDDDVYYRKKISRPRAAQSTSHLDWIRDNYPRDDDEMLGIHPIFYEYDRTCNCQLHLSREELIEYKKDKRHARRCNLDPIQAEIILKKYHSMYTDIYEREPNPDRNTQETPVQRSFMLEE